MPGRFLHCLFAVATALTLAAGGAFGQPAAADAEAAATQPAASQAASQPATAAASRPATAPISPPPIPLGQINEKADPDSAIARDIAAESSADRIVPEIAIELPDLLKEIDARAAETTRLLSAAPSLADLRNLESDWQAIQETLDEWRGALARRAPKLDANVATLSNMNTAAWVPTLESIRASNEPPELIQQAESVVAVIDQSREMVEQRRATVLSLQSRVRELSVRVSTAIAAINNEQGAARNRLLARDSPPIWDLDGQRIAGLESHQSIRNQWLALRAYAARKQFTFALHLVAWLMLLPAFFWIRQWARGWVREDPTLRRSELAFESPVATATITALLLSGWLYPHAPRLLGAIIIALALAPTIIVVRRLLDQRLLPILYALGVFFTIDRLRSVILTQPRMHQFLLVVEMAAGAALLFWFIRSGRLRAAVNYSDAVEGAIVVTCRIFGILFLTATIAAALGYVALATLLGDAVLGSAYLAVILYAATRIIEGLVMVLLRVRPVSLLQAVSKNRRLVWVRTCRVINWLALLIWLLGTLEMLSVRQIFVRHLYAAFTATLTVGAFSLSLGQVVAFGLAVWASILASRFIRFILQEDVYPRFHLARGLPYAISTVLHYAILLIGFTTAVQMLGYDMTKFTILAGAFGVGLGFGLQNIFNNFVSGLILLFERPIKVGDVIQVGADTGTVRRIGIRASVIRLGSGAEVIMPNGRLIADPVTNWTLSGRGRDIAMELSVAAGTEPRQVIALWSKVTAVHPKIAEEPPPRAVLTGLTADALKFDLRAWTSEFETWSATRSDLAIALNAALADAGIVVK